jgi:hypothetical protein
VTEIVLNLKRVRLKRVIEMNGEARRTSTSAATPPASGW